jgi:hypothetical protein
MMMMAIMTIMMIAEQLTIQINLGFFYLFIFIILCFIINFNRGVGFAQSLVGVLGINSVSGNT